MKITERQRRFVDYFIELGNIEQAAVKAGYSERYARGNAHKLVANVSVQAYLTERREQADAQRIASGDEVLRYLTSVMRNETTEQIPLLVGEGMQSLANKEVGAKERIKAAELLGKRYLLFSDKLNVDGMVQVTIGGEQDLED